MTSLTSRDRFPPASRNRFFRSVESVTRSRSSLARIERYVYFPAPQSYHDGGAELACKFRSQVQELFIPDRLRLFRTEVYLK